MASAPADHTPSEGVTLQTFNEFRREVRREARLLRKELAELTRRVELLDLNGSIETLRQLGAAAPHLLALAAASAPLLHLADSAPTLLAPEMIEMRAEAMQNALLMRRFVEVAPQILAAADRAADDAAFWLGVRKRLNPFRPVGAVLWVLSTGFLLAIGSGLYRLLAPLFGWPL